MITVFVQIGNSDDKLPQSEWSNFVLSVDSAVSHFAMFVHGSFFSVPNSRFQNACWCFEIGSVSAEQLRQRRLPAIRDMYKQDSIAWSVVSKTEFI